MASLKIQTGESSFLQSFYFPEILGQLKTNIGTNFPFEIFFSICDSTAEFLFFHVTTVHMAAESGCLVGFEMCGISGASFRYGFPAGAIAIRQSISLIYPPTSHSTKTDQSSQLNTLEAFLHHV